jgi:DNA recombination protein RmuC
MNPDTTLLTLVILLTAIVITLLIIIVKKTSSIAGDKKEDIGLKLILEQINELNRTVDKKIGENAQQMHESLKHQSTESFNIIRDITEKLTRLDETNKQVVSFADQLQNLQDILKNPKQRGILGEYYLETLLKNVLAPGQYKIQYEFKNGEIVDAAVFVKDKIIPVDSKFSLENYNRLIDARDPSEKERLEKAFVNDLKLRIVETSKYIRPEENTMDFAFMFIPHEAIYYDLLINKIGAVTEDTENLIQRAAGKYKVIIVSPTSFLAYLQTVLQALKAFQIEESAKDIKKNVENLQKHLLSYQQYQEKLGNALSTTVSHFNNSNKEFKKIDKDMVRITGTESDLEILEIAKPEKDE